MTTWNSTEYLLKLVSHLKGSLDVKSHYISTYIRSLDYGSVSYLSARVRTLKILDPIHNTGLCHATGDFMSSPAYQSLHWKWRTTTGMDLCLIVLNLRWTENTWIVNALQVQSVNTILLCCTTTSAHTILTLLSIHWPTGNLNVLQTWLTWVSSLFENWPSTNKEI